MKTKLNPYVLIFGCLMGWLFGDPCHTALVIVFIIYLFQDLVKMKEYSELKLWDNFEIYVSQLMYVILLISVTH